MNSHDLQSLHFSLMDLDIQARSEAFDPDVIGTTAQMPFLLLADCIDAVKRLRDIDRLARPHNNPGSNVGAHALANQIVAIIDKQ